MQRVVAVAGILSKTYIHDQDQHLGLIPAVKGNDGYAKESSEWKFSEVLF